MILNAKIITVDANNTIAQAVAVSDSLIIKVGTNQDIQPFIGPGTKILDLTGKTVTPGLIDAHNHLVYYGQSEKDFVNLRPPAVRSIADIVAKVAERIRQSSPGAWVIGDGFFQLTDGRLPTRWDLDPVSPDNPVFLNSMGGHFGTANSKALEIAGIDSSTPNPVGGIIEKDSTTGEPTGVLWNHPAQDLVRKYYPVFDVDALTADVLFAQDKYLTEGLTSFQDVNTRGMDRVKGYVGAVDSLKLRGYLLFTIERSKDAATSLQYLQLYTGPKLSFGGDKFLLDGQAPTSYTYEPHPGASWDMPTWNPDTLKQAVKELHRAGHQLAFHVIGDKAIDLALDAIEEALNDTPRPNHRHRLEHCNIPTTAAIQRIKRLGVVVSTQPAAIFYFGDSYISTWGAQRALRLVPLRTFLDAGVPVALGSDFPTVPYLFPLLALQSALVRKSASGVIMNAQERITIQEALRAHTMGSAYAAFEENIKGSIEVGKYADMTVLSDDLYSVEVSRIKDLKIEMVIIGGEIHQPAVVGVEMDQPVAMPSLFALYQNYPNPFNSSTEISYHLPATGTKMPVHITLEVYNILGERVRTLVDQDEPPGLYTIQWDGKNDDGMEVSSGIYLYRMSAGDFVQTRVMVLQK